jgi:drug/metabolite transporter (DMT)-like permease
VRIFKDNKCTFFKVYEQFKSLASHLIFQILAKPRHWFILVLLALIWGSSFILIKRGLFDSGGQELFTGSQVGALRVVIAALFMLPLAIPKMKLLRNGRWKFFLAVGLFGNAIPAFLFANAQTHIPSALAGMLNAMVPIFSMLIAVFIFHVKVKWTQVLGIFLGLFSAAGILLAAGGFQGVDIHPGYSLLVVLATLCYAISLNVIKQFLQDEPAVAITGLALVLVSPLGILVLLSTDFAERLSHLDGALKGLGAVTLLAVFGTALALILFNRLVQQTNTLFASSVTYLIPLVAVLWGVFDGEFINETQVLCGVAMLFGIVLINRRKK